MLYDNSGDEYNVGYDSLSEKNKKDREVSPSAPSSPRSQNLSNNADSEVTAPPTPHSTDSEELPE